MEEDKAAGGVVFDRESLEKRPGILMIGSSNVGKRTLLSLDVDTVANKRLKLQKQAKKKAEAQKEKDLVDEESEAVPDLGVETRPKKKAKRATPKVIDVPPSPRAEKAIDYGVMVADPTLESFLRDGGTGPKKRVDVCPSQPAPAGEIFIPPWNIRATDRIANNPKVAIEYLKAGQLPKEREAMNAVSSETFAGNAAQSFLMAAWYGYAALERGALASKPASSLKDCFEESEKLVSDLYGKVDALVAHSSKVEAELKELKEWKEKSDSEKAELMERATKAEVKAAESVERAAKSEAEFARLNKEVNCLQIEKEKEATLAKNELSLKCTLAIRAGFQVGAQKARAFHEVEVEDLEVEDDDVDQCLELMEEDAKASAEASD